MAKNLSVSVLMDFYGGLLTDKQKEALELYYNQDFSLAEIAENMDISRQGVRDFIKRGEKQLTDFEEGLGLLKRFSQINHELTALSTGLSKLNEMKLPKAAADIVSELTETVCKIENNL
jgi:predicted DNA-binding protein YlxM (UPF0122 family)